MSHEHHHHGHHGHGGHHDHHPAPTAPPVSLLRMSLAERLGWATGALALIWVGVFWAMR